MKRRVKMMSMVFVIISIIAGTLYGCGTTGENSSSEGNSSEESTSGKTIEMEIGYTDEALDKFREIIVEFTEKTNISVELITPGSDYETVMKTRMASGDMPDVFVTHGWSIARYKEYLLELNDQPWFDTVGESIKGVVSDQDGKVYVLPVTQGVNGIEYNKEVLEAAGVDVKSLQTMEGFQDACEKIKAAGAVPVFIGGKDYWTSASYLGTMIPGYYTAEGAELQAAAQLKEGSFDWETDGLDFFNDIRDMVEKGYFNEDFITADETQGFEALAAGKCAFLVGGIAIDRVLQYNADAEIGILPVPSTTAGGKVQYSVGEGSAFGIWKDSEYIAEAKQLLEFLAEPDIAARIVELDGQLPALTNIDTASNKTFAAFTESQELLGDVICYDNLFDREYLPSGMWTILSDSMMEVFMDPTDAGVQSATKSMQENYLDKWEAEN